MEDLQIREPPTAIEVVKKIVLEYAAKGIPMAVASGNIKQSVIDHLRDAGASFNTDNLHASIHEIPAYFFLLLFLFCSFFLFIKFCFRYVAPFSSDCCFQRRYASQTTSVHFFGSCKANWGRTYKGTYHNRYECSVGWY